LDGFSLHLDNLRNFIEMISLTIEVIEGCDCCYPEVRTCIFTLFNESRVSVLVNEVADVSVRKSKDFADYSHKQKFVSKRSSLILEYGEDKGVGIQKVGSVANLRVSFRSRFTVQF
jgi:hypothetical protein